MKYSIVTPTTEEALEAFLPVARLRSLCFVNNTRQDGELKLFRAAAIDTAQLEARCIFLPQTIERSYRTPYAGTKNFGLEAKFNDPDGVRASVNLLGPVRSIESVIFQDASGVEVPALSDSLYTVNNGRFLRWGEFDWSLYADKTTFTVRYEAGFADNDPKLPSVQLALGELVAAMWDGKGGTWKVPTSARRTFLSCRTSRTFNPA